MKKVISTMTGKPMLELTEAEYIDLDDNNCGFCRNCGAIEEGGCEPDARKYECSSCEAKAVYGIQESLIRGFLTMVDEEEV